MRHALMTLLLSVLFSCDRIVPDLKGSLIGYIRSLDEFALYNNDDEGFEVVARGNGYHTTYTDKDGRFEFTDLPCGTYELSIFKEGYGLMKVFSVQHLGGAPTILNAGSGAIIKYYLYRIPETRITSLSVKNDTIRTRFDFKSDAPASMALQIYYSEIENFSKSEIRNSVFCRFNKSGDIYTALFDYRSLNFYKGQRVYMRACIRNLSTSGISYYYDNEQSCNIYPNLSAESDEFWFNFRE